MWVLIDMEVGEKETPREWLEYRRVSIDVSNYGGLEVLTCGVSDTEPLFMSYDTRLC